MTRIIVIFFYPTHTFFLVSLWASRRCFLTLPPSSFMVWHPKFKIAVLINQDITAFFKIFFHNSFVHTTIPQTAPLKRSQLVGCYTDCGRTEMLRASQWWKRKRKLKGVNAEDRRCGGKDAELRSGRQVHEDKEGGAGQGRAKQGGQFAVQDVDHQEGSVSNWTICGDQP